MSNEKELKKGNGQVPETTEGQDEQDETVEGYETCTSYAQRCANDCLFGGPSLSHIE